MDVFISYSTKDQELIEEIVRHLEAAGISCWFAPRNIMPGAEWVTAINDAIEEAKIFLLIYTENSNSSRQVHNEVALAFNMEKIMIPLRLADIPMNTEMKYYLTRVHWLDAVNQTPEHRMESVTDYVQAILHWEKTDKLTGNLAGHDAKEQGNPQKNGVQWMVRIFVAVILALCILCVGILFSKRQDSFQEAYAQGQEFWEEGRIKEARYCFEKAALQGDTRGQLALGTMHADELLLGMRLHEKDLDVNAESAEIKKYGEELVRGGFTEANYLLGFYYAEEFNGVRDKKKAFSYFELAAQSQDAEWRLRSLGYMCFLHGISDQEMESSLEMVDSYAEKIRDLLEEMKDRKLENWPAYSKTCELAGNAYRNLGEGEKAFAWYQKAAEAGNMAAMNQLGLAYLRGDGVEENKEFAREWFQKAADAGEESAKGNLEYLLNMEQ